MIDVIYECDDYIVINKKAGVPSAPLSEKDEFNALFLAAKIYPDIMKVKGKKEIERGLVHRIDTQTSGLLLIARNQSAYDALINLQTLGRCIKEYTAFVDVSVLQPKGFPKFYEDVYKSILSGVQTQVKSYFRAYGVASKEVRPVSLDASANTPAALKKSGNKIYCTTISYSDGICKCKITNGFRHQVRAHLSWCGFPVIGDNLYNSNYIGRTDCNLEFYATGISFPDLVTQEIRCFSIAPPDKKSL